MKMFLIVAVLALAGCATTYDPGNPEAQEAKLYNECMSAAQATGAVQLGAAPGYTTNAAPSIAGTGDAYCHSYAARRVAH